MPKKKTELKDYEIKKDLSIEKDKVYVVNPDKHIAWSEEDCYDIRLVPIGNDQVEKVKVRIK
jgi:hypothetical protein